MQQRIKENRHYGKCSTLYNFLVGEVLGQQLVPISVGSSIFISADFREKEKKCRLSDRFSVSSVLFIFLSCDSCPNPEMHRRSGILESDLALSGSACTGAGGDLPFVQD